MSFSELLHESGEKPFKTLTLEFNFYPKKLIDKFIHMIQFYYVHKSPIYA